MLLAQHFFDFLVKPAKTDSSASQTELFLFLDVNFAAAAPPQNVKIVASATTEQVAMAQYQAFLEAENTFQSVQMPKGTAQHSMRDDPHAGAKLSLGQNV